MGDTKIQVLPTPVKSESDNKEYRVIKLENGLTATIISDEVSKEIRADQANLENTSGDEKVAAVALYIGVGSFSDPLEIAGLSHFLEHMVFMGSEKFPVDNDFDFFLKNSGGRDNAYTEIEGTTFYFQVFEQYLPKALDKFSQFFISPLMKREALTREREVVDSEFHIALPIDSYRKHQVLMTTAKKDSPVYQSFRWGNLKTLKDNISDEKLYEEVNKHRKRHYSAHRMTLAVQARSPLDVLQSLVVQYFSNIPNNKLLPLDFSAFTHTVFDTPEFNKIYYVKPLREVTEVELNWSLPSIKYEYKSKHIKYLSSLLGNEGEGSILSYLKKNMWAVFLSAGDCLASLENNSIYSFFTIHVTLTDEGLKHVFDVVAVIFAYINLLKNIGPQRRIYDELKLASHADFRFGTESAYITCVLAAAMQVYPPADIICGNQLYFEYNPEKITETLNCLTPKTANIIITSKKLPDGLVFDQTEKWFGAEYTNVDIPESLQLQWEMVTPYPELNIPPPNPYLTINFTMLPELPNNPLYPQKLIDTPKCELWYRQDQTFKLPRASYSYLLINPICIESPKNSALTEMYADLLLFLIGEDVYPASLANLVSYFCCDERGIFFEAFGFNEKLPVLLELMTKYIKNLCDYINEDHFNGVREILLKRYYNDIFLLGTTLHYELESKLFLKNHFSALDTYTALSKVTFDDMNQFIKEFHKNMYIKALVQGNVLPGTACETTDNLIKYLEFEEVPKNKYPKIKKFQVPIGEKCLRVESLNKKDSNSITLNYYQVGSFTLKDNVLLDIFIGVIGEPCNNILRTDEQLGYDISCSGSRSYGVLEYRLTVNSQANKYSTEYLDSRIEALLTDSQKLLEEISVDNLEKIKEDLIKIKECRDDNLREESSRNWSEITSDEYMFDRAKQEIEILKHVTLDEFKVWWNELCQSENVRKISIQVVGHIQDNTTSEVNIPDDENCYKDVTLKILGNNKNRPEQSDYFIEDIDTFVANLCTYPDIV